MQREERNACLFSTPLIRALGAAVLIRRYQDHDQGGVKTLHRLAMEEVGAFLPGPWDRDLESIRGTYLNGRGEFLVGEIGSEIVAMGALRSVDETRGELKRIRVSPPHQRQGVGQEILAQLELRAVSVGYEYLELDTLESQSGAIGFFLKNGYRQIGTRRFQGHVQLLFRKALAGGT